MLEIKDIDIDIDDELIKEPYIAVVTISIGIRNEIGADFFELTVCNLEGFKKYIVDEQVNNGLLENISFFYDKAFIIQEYSHSELINYIQNILNKIFSDNKSWTQMAIELNNYFYWEYYNEWKNEAIKTVSNF